MAKESIAENKPEETKIEGNRQAPLTIEEFYNEKVKNLDAIESKFNTLDTAYRARPNSPEKRSLETQENIMSSLRTQAAEIISTTLSDSEIQPLVDAIYSNAEQSLKLIKYQNEDNNKIQEEIKKFNLANAKAEAALKNFGLDLSPSNVQDMDVKGKVVGINRQEAMALSEPLEKALLSVAQTKTSKEQYTNKIIDEVLKELDSQGISKEKQDGYKVFMLRNCNKKFDRIEEFSQTQLENLQEKTKKSVVFFKNKLNESELEQKNLYQNVEPAISFVENVGVKKIETIRRLLPTITKLNPEEMQEKSKEIVKNFAPLLESKNEKLAKSTESTLAKLDSGYLSEYSAVIAAELKTVNEKGTSWWEKFKSVFTNTDYLAERLEKVIDNYVVKNDEYVEKEINNKIFLNAMPEKQLATGLSEFIEQNKDKLKDLEAITSKTKTSKEITSKELAQLRKVNPVGFDKALFGQAPHYTVPENREEIQAAMVVPPPPLMSQEEELAKELASVPPPPLEQSATVAQQTQQAKQAPSYDKIPPPPPSLEVTREVAPPQKPVTPTKTPSWQQTVSNRRESQKKDGGIAP